MLSEFEVSVFAPFLGGKEWRWGFLEAMLSRSAPGLASSSGACERSTPWLSPRRTARESSAHIKIVLFNPTRRNGPEGDHWWSQGQTCACLSFPLQGQSLMFKVGDSQSQEIGQTSKLRGDAEAPASRKQAFRASPFQPSQPRGPASGAAGWALGCRPGG